MHRAPDCLVEAPSQAVGHARTPARPHARRLQQPAARCGILEGMSDEPLPPPKDKAGPYRVCFVCLGNICRSPMAEVVTRAKLAQAGLAGRVVVDSAGTGDWHVGAHMHQGARSQLERRGYDGSAHRARQFSPSWLAGRDLVLAMDSSNLAALLRSARTDPDHRIRLFGEVGGLGGKDKDVPDPYGASPDEFARVLGIVESGSERLVARLAELLGTPAQPGR